MGSHAVAARAILQNPVTVIGASGQGRPGFMKTLPIELAVARKSAKYNRIGLFLPTSDVQEGDLVQQAGETYIVGNLSPDVHRGRAIRLAAELIWCSHFGVTAYRPELVRHPTSGAILDSTAAPVASGISLLFTTSDLFVEGSREVDIGYWNVYISMHVPQLQAEDYLEVDGKQYEVKFHRHDVQGAWTYRVMRATR